MGSVAIMLIYLTGSTSGPHLRVGAFDNLGLCEGAKGAARAYYSHTITPKALPACYVTGYVIRPLPDPRRKN